MSDVPFFILTVLVQSFVFLTHGLCVMLQLLKQTTRSRTDLHPSLIKCDSVSV